MSEREANCVDPEYRALALEIASACRISKLEGFREAIEAAARWHDREADILDRSFKQMRAEGFPVDNENAARHRRYAQAIRALGEKAGKDERA